MSETATARCLEHSGYCSDIQALQRSDKAQWEQIREQDKTISGFKNWLIGNLVALIFVLLGVIATYFKMGG